MTWRFPAANKLAVSLAAISVIAVGFAMSAANAEPKRQTDERGRAYYGANGPNVSYQQGRTRIYVSRRSWLDAGVEVLPGDRKFTDYAYPPGRSFGLENRNRPLDRQPLNPDFDLGGYPRAFPPDLWQRELTKCPAPPGPQFDC